MSSPGFDSPERRDPNEQDLLVRGWRVFLPMSEAHLGGLVVSDPKDMAEIEADLDRWLDALQRQGHEVEKAVPHIERSDFSPTEQAEMAKASADRDGLKSHFEMLRYGHAAVLVGYPTGYPLGQHPTHQKLQQEYEMVTVTNFTIENPPEVHDYEMVVYMHREDYDDAVLSGAMELYKDEVPR